MSEKLGRTKLRNAAYAAMWSILPAKLDAVLEFLDLRAEGHTLSKRELARRGFSTVALRPGTVEASKGGRVAVLPLSGVIAHHAGFEMQISGGTSTVAFGQAFDAAVNDPNVSAIVIDCDSPGGTVEGVAELFDKIYSARGKKPIKAAVNANCHSAAYWICAAADEIVCTPSGSVGNIGVMTVHTDTSAMDEKNGVKRTLIKAGKHKGEGAPFEPLSADAESAIQEQVDEIYGLFVEAVAKGRGVKVSAVRNGFGEGRSVRAKQSVDIGLADRIGTLESLLGEFGASAPAKTARGGMTALHAMDEEPGSCPDCGGEQEMKDGEPFCPECDEPDTESLIPAAAIAAVASVLPELASVVSAEIAPSTLTASIARPGGSTAVSPAQPTQTTSQDTSMPEITQTPAEMLAELRKAEAARVTAIRALCADHALSLKADKFIEDGLSIDAVRAAILDEKKTVTAATRVPLATNMVQRSTLDAKKGFSNHREFFSAVIQNRSRDLSQVKDDRLKALAVKDTDENDTNGGEMAFMLPTGLHATVGSDEQGNYSDAYGGFAGNQVTRLAGLRTVPADSDPTAGRTLDVPMNSTTVEVYARTDKDHTTSVAGGLTFARRAEASAISASRMQTELVTMKASMLAGLAYATEEVLTDSPESFAALIDAGFRDQLGAHLINEKLFGNGGSEYEGILNAPALISVAKESAQLADTIVTQNLLKMRARCWGYGNAIWIANQDTLPQLGVLSVGVGTAGALVYQQSMREDMPDMLLGRPIFYSEFAATVGDVGDIILANWSQYLEGTYQPLQSAESIHVRFVNHERAFKFWTRNAGQCWWRSALTPKKSTATLSPFVALAAR